MLVAYYCFVNFGWPPSKYETLQAPERALVKAFALRSMDERKKIEETAGKR